MAYAYPEDVHRLYIISYGIPVCPQGSQISANLMKSFKMTNFAPCGPIFKIRNSKQVYSKSYNQISDCIFLKPAISRQTSCKQIKSLIANLKSCLKVPCVPTVHCSDTDVSPTLCHKTGDDRFNMQLCRIHHRLLHPISFGIGMV